MRRFTAGFTLIELVVVIAIIAILAVVALPRWQSGTTNVEYEVRRVLTDLRFAQLLSVTTGQRYRWVRNSATSYQILNQAGVAIVLPSGGAQWNLLTGESFGTFTNLPNNLIAFNTQGVPYTDAAIPGTALSATATIILTGGGIS